MTPQQAISSSRLGLGTSVLASWRGGLSRKKADQLISRGLEEGIRLIDTSDTYASGECERLLGHLLKDRRDHFSIMTKSGYTRADFPGALHLLNPIGKKVIQKIGPRQCFDPAYLRNSIIRSLERLGTDYLDIFVLHDPPAEVLRDGQIFDLLDSFREAGYTGATGISSGDDEAISLAMKWKGCSVIQTPLQADGKLAPSLFDARAKGILVILNHVSLGGKLPGDSNSNDPPLANYRKMISERAMQLNVNPHAALLALALESTGASSVLTGTRNLSHLLENVRAVKGSYS
jgi:aryl-alcohol dehydrogenase-like predicted oxidoreductase